MAERKQTFRFRLPWATAPAATRPSQVSQAPSSPEQSASPTAPVQRRPFRPAGFAAPSTGQSQAKAETPPASPSSTRKYPSSRVPSRLNPPRQNAPPARGQRASPSASPSPPPSHGVSQETKSITPTKLPAKEQTDTTEIPEPRKNQKEQETSLPESQKPQIMDTETPETEKVIDTVKGKAELLLASAKTKLKQSQKPQHMDTETPEKEKVVDSLKSKAELLLPSEKTKLKRPLVINPEPESNQASKQPMEIIKGMDHEEYEKETTHEKPQGSKAGNTFDRKEVMKIFEHKEHDKSIKEHLPKIKHKHELNENPFSFITLTGENTGAIMHLSSERGKRETPIHIHRGYKAKADENSVAITENAAGSSKGRKPYKLTNTEDNEEQAKNLYVNNNTQGINNSLVANSSVTERNPGTHVVLKSFDSDSDKSENTRRHVISRVKM